MRTVAYVAAMMGVDPRVCMSTYSRPSPESMERAVRRLVGDDEGEE